MGKHEDKTSDSESNHDIAKVGFLNILDILLINNDSLFPDNMTYKSEICQLSSL
jgi:hypothetical protein